jgi:hypothetical protein
MPKKPDPDPEAVERAAEVHRDIEALKRQDAPAPAAGAAAKAGAAPISPREFIHKRMAELDKKKKDR